MATPITPHAATKLASTCTARVHIIHDIDRDGWGSAALLLAHLGADACVLHPTRSKQVMPRVAQLSQADSAVWVLDIPAPREWPSEAPAGSVTWVDHHLEAWTSPRPKWLRAILPADAGPTTTMSLLVRRGLAGGSHTAQFVRSVCGGHSEWGPVFDGLSTLEELPIAEEDLRAALPRGPRGEPPPRLLRFAWERAEGMGRAVREILADAELEVSDDTVVAHIATARGLPLQRFSLTLRERYPDKVAVLVHRRHLLYCGRDSRRRGLDFLRHFRSRGFSPKGHAYVAFAVVGARAMKRELDALRFAIGACR